MADQKSVTIGKTETANNRPFTLIAGPCAMESDQHALEMSAALCEMTARLGLDFIYEHPSIRRIVPRTARVTGRRQ